MPDTVQPPLLLILAEVACWLAGIVLLVRLIKGRLGPNRSALTPWIVSVEQFVTVGLLVILGGLLAPHGVTYLGGDVLGPAARNGSWWLMVQGAAFQLGLLGGALLGLALLRLRSPRAAPPPAPDQPRSSQPVLAGLVTFLIALPLIGALGFAWKAILDSLGYSTGEQDMVDLFRNADDPALLLLMTLLAAVVAPVTEELIFRAGLFRYLRTRIPRSLALALPAVVFALLHGNLAAFVPLFALGVFFACAYERTGCIAVPMIAHALFNLHTIVLVMAGVSG